MRLIAFAVLLSAASTAGAQSATSAREIASPAGGVRDEIASTDAALRDIIRCVADYQTARTRNLLDTIPGSRRATVLMRSFWSRMESCHEGQRTGGFGPRIDQALIRGAIAELYYRCEFPNGITPAPGIVAEILAAWARPRPVDTGDTSGELVHATARCVVVRRPEAVAAMIASPRFSPTELAAMHELRADLSACLDARIEFAVSRQSLRAILAEAALHYGEALSNGFDKVGRGNPDLE